MAKGKKSSETPIPKKSAAKKSSAQKAAVNKPEAKIAVMAASASAPVSASTVYTAQPTAAQLHDEIRQRAYELFRQRGGQHGSHEADWHRAESEVRSKYNKGSAR